MLVMHIWKLNYNYTCISAGCALPIIRPNIYLKSVLIARIESLTIMLKLTPMSDSIIELAFRAQSRVFLSAELIQNRNWRFKLTDCAPLWFLNERHLMIATLVHKFL